MLRREVKFNYANAIVGVVFLVMALITLFWLAKGIFAILAWVAPILLIATIIIDYRIILDYGKWILRQLKNNVISGVIFTILTIIGFPVVSFLLFGKALLRRKVKSLEAAYREQRTPSFTEYEIIDEEPLEPMQLPKLEKRRESSTDEYEQLF